MQKYKMVGPARAYLAGKYGEEAVCRFEAAVGQLGVDALVTPLLAEAALSGGTAKVTRDHRTLADELAAQLAA